ALVADPSPVARQLGAELLLGWGDPARAWAVFEPAVTAAGSPQAAFALRRFADLAAARGTAEGRRVRALALARLAAVVPQPGAGRWCGPVSAAVSSHAPTRPSPATRASTRRRCGDGWRCIAAT